MQNVSYSKSKECYSHSKWNYSINAGNVPIAGIQPLTTIDFPGEIAAVLFTQGCPWHCRYCHNAELRSFNKDNLIPFDTVAEFLTERVGFIDGIVLSGGEPTLHSALPELMAWIRELGYLTALHTNGNSPNMLRLLFKRGLVDYVAMDVKAPLRAYDRVTQTPNSFMAIPQSIDIILSSGVKYEFRTSYHPNVINEMELTDIIHYLSGMGARHFYIQRFQPQRVPDNELVRNGKVITIPETVCEEARKCFDMFGVR